MVEFSASVATPAVSDQWRKMSLGERRKLVDSAMDCFEGLSGFVIKLIDVSSNGEVIVEYDKTPPASSRGQHLLALESHLKDRVDLGITVWHASLGDKNSLRRLRGVSVK